MTTLGQGIAFKVGNHPQQVGGAVLFMGSDLFVVQAAYQAGQGQFRIAGSGMFQGATLKFKDTGRLGRIGDLENKFPTVLAAQPKILIALTNQWFGNSVNAEVLTGHVLCLLRREVRGRGFQYRESERGFRHWEASG